MHRSNLLLMISRTAAVRITAEAQRIAEIAKQSIILVAALFLIPGCKQEAPPHPPAPAIRNVVLITVDTLRPDALSVYGGKTKTPFFDRLALRSLVFENAFTPVPVTLPAHTSILTGLNPPATGVRHNGIFRASPALTLMPEIAKQHGLKTAAFIGGFPLASQFGLNQGFDVYDDSFPETASEPGTFAYAERNAKQVLGNAKKWLSNLRKQESFFLWIHLFDPHHPYREHGNTPVSPYQQEVLYVDNELDQFFQYLEQNGLQKSTMMIVTSDHGEAFGEHGEVSHSLFIYNTTLRIPLFLLIPGETPGRQRGLVRLIDLFPTVMDAMDWESANTVDGKSMIPLIHGEEKIARELYAETMAPAYDFGWSPLFAVQTLQSKFIEAPRPEYYDLKADPGETDNRAGKSDVSAMQEKLRKLRTSVAPPAAHTPTNEERERLAALGYVSPSHRANPASAIDPKDRVETARKLAELTMSPSPIEEKAKAYRELAVSDPSNPLVLLRYAEILLRLNKLEDAAQTFQKVITLKYPSAAAYNGLAVIHFTRKQPDLAEKSLNAALTDGVADGETYYNLAEFSFNHGDRDQAFKYYDRSIEFGFLEAYYRKSRLKAVMGDSSEALQILRNVETEYPGRARTSYERAMILFRQSNFAEALAAFQDARKRSPDDLALTYNIGITYLKMGSQLEARKELQAFLQKAPQQLKQERSTAQSILASQPK